MTGRNPEERWVNNGREYKNKCHHFWNAIQMYGWDSFSHDIVGYNLTRQEAEETEIALIEELNTRDREYGYNISKGGTGGNQKEIIGVKQYDLEGNFIAEYESAAEAARAIGISRSPITRCCKHGGKTHGYMFCYSSEEITEPYKRNDQKDIFKFDLDGNLVRKYRTFKEILDEDNELKIVRLHGATTKYKTHYYNGFIWIYEEDICNLDKFIVKTKKYFGLNTHVA